MKSGHWATTRPGQLLVALVLLLGLVTGCSQVLAAVELDRAVSMAVTYQESGRSEVSVTYTVPEPPPGNVYVLWILNPDQGQRAKVGVIRSGAHRVVKTTVDFEALGAVVSVEPNPEVEQMNNVWALRVGLVNAGEVAGQTPIPVGGEAGTRRTP